MRARYRVPLRRLCCVLVGDVVALQGRPGSPGELGEPRLVPPPARGG